MGDLRTTNWLLAGILGMLMVHAWIGLQDSAQADTLRLDDCITEHLGETPRQYLHVVVHPQG